MVSIVPVGGMRPVHGTASNAIVDRLVTAMGGKSFSRDWVLPAEATLYMQHGFKLTPMLQDAIDKRVPFVIVDHGYYGNRIATMSLSINGFHGLSMPVPEVRLLKPRPRPTLEPWREGGTHVYVYGQLQNDRACRGQNMETWPTRTAQAAAEAFSMPAIVRPHPKSIRQGQPPLPALETTFADAYVAVTWTSTVGVLAAIAGVPLVAMHPASPAFAVGSPSLSRIRMPGRESWLHDLSYRQYGLGEIGAAIDYIRLAYPAALAAAKRGEFDTIGLRV